MSRVPALEESLLVQLRFHGTDWDTSEWQVRCFEELPSTMDTAREMIPELSPEKPGLVLARLQTKGRGRQGRSWEPSKGAFYATFVFSTKKPPSAMSGYSLVIGCGIHAALSALGCELGVKWPNDILSLDGRKVGGILVEQVCRDGVTFVLAGIGLNLEASPAGVPQAAAIYELTQLRPQALDLAARLFPVLFADFCRFREQGFDVFKDRFLSCAMFLGEKATLAVGQGVITGKVYGVGDSGALLLQTEQGITEIVSGHFLKVENYSGSGNFCA